ncbi:MAG: tetratricopeptide repeat protein [Gemmatimonadetes bacterium]|nr:MAG: tetratricopeptide repeat protein [Gemmatimonadota bacterium]
MSKKRIRLLVLVGVLVWSAQYVPGTIRWVDSQMAIVFAQRALQEGDQAAALNWLQRCTSLNPQHTRAYRLMGEIFYFQKRWAEAVRAYEKAVAAGSTDAVMFNNLGWTLIEHDLDYEKGIEYAKRSLELDPDKAYTEDTLGWGYYKLGDYEQALYWVEKAYQRAPHEPELKTHYDVLVDLVKQEQ